MYQSCVILLFRSDRHTTTYQVMPTPVLLFTTTFTILNNHLQLLMLQCQGNNILCSVIKETSAYKRMDK